MQILVLIAFVYMAKCSESSMMKTLCEFHSIIHTKRDMSLTW
jgi:hypothetical protein